MGSEFYCTGPRVHRTNRLTLMAMNSLAPYERRVIELLRNSKDKRARKLAKKRVCIPFLPLYTLFTIQGWSSAFLNLGNGTGSSLGCKEHIPLPSRSFRSILRKPFPTYSLSLPRFELGHRPRDTEETCRRPAQLEP
jgi:hypothetical protein